MAFLTKIDKHSSVGRAGSSLTNLSTSCSSGFRSDLCHIVGVDARLTHLQLSVPMSHSLDSLASGDVS